MQEGDCSGSSEPLLNRFLSLLPLTVGKLKQMTPNIVFSSTK